MKVDRGRLFVAGGPTGDAFVYNAKTGALIAASSSPQAGDFVNDVVVTKRAAWFTDSFKARSLSRCRSARAGGQVRPPPCRRSHLTGDYVQQQPGFNVNGIDATPNGKTLVLVQSSDGKLFTVERRAA